jgi:hypothetical protein
MTPQYLNPDFLAGRPTGTCCRGCAKRDGCPMEAVGRKCTLEGDSCMACTHWDERGCFCCAIDKNLLKLQL